MSLNALLAFTAGMVLLSLTPGVGVATVVARALKAGLRPAFAVIGGLVVGDLVFMGLALSGLAALATTAAPLFQIVKYAGAAYLIWLGYPAFRGARRAAARR